MISLMVQVVMTEFKPVMVLIFSLVAPAATPFMERAARMYWMVVAAMMCCMGEAGMIWFYLAREMGEM